jgi:predicted transglutaminase-like cysteine proteinase
MSTIIKAALLGCGLIAGAMTTAKAVEWDTKTELAPRSNMHLRVYGKTLPPIGYVQFCKSHSKQCAQRGGNTRQAEMTNNGWAELTRVNKYVNDKVAPVTDQDLYEVAEHWTYPDAQGDCEDYVLLKKYYLTEMGWPPEVLLITVVLDEQGAGHAVLIVKTDLGDFVLDNQNKDILPWQDTPYRYIKRQSQNHPSVWVSLDPNYTSKRSTTAGRLITDR